MNAVEAVVGLVSGGNVLIGVDFDGTLAPLVSHPDLAVPDTRAVAHLRSLAARPDIRVAIVSGRARADLGQRLGEIPGAILVGEHGNDTGEDTPPAVVIRAARRFLENLRGARDVTIETKPSSVTFHTRNLAEDEKRDAVERVRRWAEEHPEVTLLEGKEVLELTIASRTKGDAIFELAQEAEGVVYLGDDTTDESVFTRMGPDDVGVKVGPGATAARYRVADVSEVVEVLAAAVRGLS